MTLKNTSIYKVQRLGYQLHCITFSSTTLNLSHIHAHLQPPVVHLQTVGSQQLVISGGEASAARIIYSPPKKLHFTTWHEHEQTIIKISSDTAGGWRAMHCCDSAVTLAWPWPQPIKRLRWKFRSSEEVDTPQDATLSLTLLKDFFFFFLIYILLLFLTISNEVVFSCDCHVRPPTQDLLCLWSRRWVHGYRLASTRC